MRAIASISGINFIGPGQVAISSTVITEDGRTLLADAVVTFDLVFSGGKLATSQAVNAAVAAVVADATGTPTASSDVSVVDFANAK